MQTRKLSKSVARRQQFVVEKAEDASSNVFFFFKIFSTDEHLEVDVKVEAE